ncbi:hypothetical protein V7S43_008658 [Phytophthora oleae]|uniref:TKL protein kinase n=1 Tax=Phytophthora oleae TaxID=2107226 RepID=A0ABD3FHK7_9STRA
MSAATSLRRRTQVSPYPSDDDRRQGTCSYYPTDAGGCRAPRSCYDCLNAELEKESDGCMINESGRCVSVIGNYDVSSDFRVVSAQVENNSRSAQPLPDPFKLEFPAVNTTYCEADDVLFNENQLGFKGFLYGTGGCVFVSVCEVPDWVYNVGGTDCSGLIGADYDGISEDSQRDDKGPASHGYLVFWCVAIAIILTLVATLAMVVTIHHHHTKRRLDELQRRRSIVVGEPVASTSRSITPKISKSGARLLNLLGWEAMRADLIEKERQDRVNLQTCPVLDSSGLGISPSTDYLQLVGVEPSAPVMSPIHSSAPRYTDN